MKFQSVVMSDGFEAIVMLAIVINAIILSFEAQYDGLELGFSLQYSGYSQQADTVWPHANEVFTHCDWFFGVAFCVELFLKIPVYGLSYFYDLWHWLDISCVVAFLIDKLMSTYVPLGGHGLRLLRLIRVFRLVRLARSLESVHHLYTMTAAIRGMTMVVTWAVLLLSLILMTAALILTLMLQTRYFVSEEEMRNLSAGEIASQHRIFEYFGTFSRSLLSMFEITLANWPPVARLLVEDVSEWFMLGVLLHKLTIGFAVLGVINGVILQETFKASSMDDVLMVRQHLRAEKHMRRKMESLFEALDADLDGVISRDDFETIDDHPEIKAWLSTMGIDCNDVTTLFKLLDVDGDGEITAEELAERIPRLKGLAKSSDVLALRKRIDL
jgi:hypothetical protein